GTNTMISRTVRSGSRLIPLSRRPPVAPGRPDVSRPPVVPGPPVAPDPPGTLVAPGPPDPADVPGSPERNPDGSFPSLIVPVRCLPTLPNLATWGHSLAVRCVHDEDRHGDD